MKMQKLEYLPAGFLAMFLAIGAATAAPSEVTINDTNVFPESITSTPDGSVIIGSLIKPFIYRAKPGATTAEPWIHFTGDQTGSTLGVLADSTTNTLWACVVEYPADTPRPPPLASRHTSLRTFDLATGVFKTRYPLPGPHNGCNDVAIAPDQTVYITDTSNGRLLRLKPGANAIEPWIQDPRLAGIDGVTFIGSKLYVNTVSSNHIYRIPVQGDGAAGEPIDIKLSQPVAGPDGMRALGDRMYLAESRTGQISELRFDGDSATVILVKAGFENPTAVSPVGGILWVGLSKQDYWRDPNLANKDPNPFKVYALPLPR